LDDVFWSEFGEILGKKPSCVKAVRDVAGFISLLERGLIFVGLLIKG
jgi:hypothetical protein